MPQNSKDPLAVRRDYGSADESEFVQTQLPSDILISWQKIALEAGNLEPNGMTLSTVSPSGKPSSRVVLLRQILDGNLVFFTNYESRKGAEIAENGFVCANFWWPETSRQVRVEGKCIFAPKDVSDEYFSNRPYESQIASAASPQSKTIENLTEVELKMDELRALRPLVRPDHWGGYLLVPDRFEFWQGRTARLHERYVTEWSESTWNWSKLAP